MIRPVEIRIAFAYLDYRVSAHISAEHLADQDITILHEGLFSATCYELASAEPFVQIDVQDHESITIIARQDGQVIAAGVYEVETSLIEELGLVLRPCVQHNLVVDQCDRTLLERASERSLAAVFKELQNFRTQENLVEAQVLL